MEAMAKALSAMVGTVAWLAGIALAQGYMVGIAIVIPPVAWYLLVKRLMQMTGVL